MASDSQKIIDILEGVNHASFANEVERLRVRAAARKLLAKVESPYERAWGFCFEHPVVFAALQTSIDLGLWAAWNAAGGGDKTIDDLVKLAKHDIQPNLLRTSFNCICSQRENLCSQLGKVDCSVCWPLSTWLKKWAWTHSSPPPSQPPLATRTPRSEPLSKLRKSEPIVSHMHDMQCH